MNTVTKEKETKKLGYYFDIIAKNSYTVADIQKNAICDDFVEALYRFIADSVLNTRSNRALLRSLEYRFGNDIAEDLHMDALLKLFAEIKQGKNKGKIRLDVIFEADRSCWEGIIFTFVRNNILLDSFKHYTSDSLDRTPYGDEDSDTTIGELLTSGEDTAEDVLSHFTFQQLLYALLVGEMTAKPVSVAYIGLLNTLSDCKAGKVQRFADLLCAEAPEEVINITLTKFVNEFNIADISKNINFNTAAFKIDVNDFRRCTEHIGASKLPAYLSKVIYKEKLRIRSEYEFLLR